MSAPGIGGGGKGCAEPEGVGDGPGVTTGKLVGEAGAGAAGVAGTLVFAVDIPGDAGVAEGSGVLSAGGEVAGDGAGAGAAVGAAPQGDGGMPCGGVGADVAGA